MGPCPDESDSESEGEVAEVPQPCAVEAMCKAKWPAQTQSAERQQATAATRGLEGRLLGRRASRRQGGLRPEAKAHLKGPMV
jgi:hypothetical protein